MKAEKKAVTINDIARAAGVSKTTVSRYINGKHSLMKEETRNHIQAVIEMTNYHPNSIAQSLKSGRSYQIGIVVADITSPFSSSLIRGIEQVLLENNYVAFLADSHDSVELEQQVIESLLSRKVDGLIVNTSDCHNPFLIQNAVNGVPIVLCDRYVNDFKFSFVGSAHDQPLFQAVEHLKEEGFAKVAFFTQEYSSNSARYIRRNTWLRALGEFYPDLDAEPLSVTIDINDMAGTISALKNLLDGCKDGEIPAIIGVNTITVMHVIAAIRSLGLRLPKDIGICGPDDWGQGEQINWPVIVSPGITTFSVPSYEIGRSAAQVLLEQICDPDAPKREVLFPSELEIRSSTRLKSAEKFP
ncbi:MAG: LacI family transcriptional regulator [Lachnospiraceae bacterium]|nr:LacI family transcriptional regulator [Lachnospiraceae bacterium]